jgi:hypothetical protein
MDNYGEYLTS